MYIVHAINPYWLTGDLLRAFEANQGLPGERAVSPCLSYYILIFDDGLQILE